MKLSIAYIQFYKSIFKGREDIYAVRWEKNGKSRYMPAFSFDPYLYKQHVMKGGTFQNYSNKKYQTLTDEQILKHLNGEQLIGIYPLLKDNTSWFIVADFDDKSWDKDCQKCIKVCADNDIPAYLERSRSGKGGHVWIFFENPYPAFRSRKLFITLLEQSGIFSIFDKHSSFDRLFPNQDYLSAKGLGNLIALPFHKTAMESGNSCFVNPDTLAPVADQWQFLKNIRRISIKELNNLYNELVSTNEGANFKEKIIGTEKTTIRLRNAVYINRTGLTTKLINFLKEELIFANTEYFVKKNTGKNTWRTERYFKMIEETDNDIIVPRGFIGKLIRFCRGQNIDYDFKDERLKVNSVTYSLTTKLKESQKPALDITLKKDFGIIVAPPASGKTIIGLSIIAKKQQPALIVVHRKQLADQWAERIESFLGIPKKEIGKIGQGKNTIGKQVTIAMIQSLEKLAVSEYAEKYLKSFGTIIIDECHHVPAETFRTTISKFNTFYLYGLTATPFRKYNDGKLIFIHLGDIIIEIKQQGIEAVPGAKIIVRNTELYIPFNSKIDKFEIISKVLVHDSTRNKLILDDVITELDKGKKAVILTERKEHLETLHQYLKRKYEVIVLSGEDSDAIKSTKWKTLTEGTFQVLITTGQYFGEGSDLQNIECLFLVYPFSFEGKLIQYIGRVQRSKVAPVIYDYRDHKIEYLEKLFQRRNAYYKKNYLTGTLFDPTEKEENESIDTLVYEQRISVSIERLEFRFGAIAFKYLIPQINIEQEFEVENVEIRPEFEVLKPYFTKVLKTKKVKIDISAKFHNGIPVTHTASSNDISKINREIIDNVKFRFISKEIAGKVSTDAGNMLNIKKVQVNEQNNPFYNSEKDFLDDILINKNVIHRQELTYLSKRHEGNIMKLRFVLSPFSFVFLLSGKQQYHIVLETLDTEEATYIWHVDKNTTALNRKLRQVDSDLGLIRVKGRQQYLETKVDNFSRVVHDYSNERKGFVIWKDLLEERLT